MKLSRSPARKQKIKAMFHFAISLAIFLVALPFLLFSIDHRIDATAAACGMNPFTSSVTSRFFVEKVAEIQIASFNAGGKRVFKGKPDNTTAVNRFEIEDLTYLPAGICFNVMSDGENKSP